MGSSIGAPLFTLTVEEFSQLLDERINAALSLGKPQKSHTSGHYVYGLRGIQQLFGVSHKTAQEYKDGILKDAVRQNGRKIVVDAELALELFNKKKNSHD